MEILNGVFRGKTSIYTHREKERERDFVRELNDLRQKEKLERTG